MYNFYILFSKTVDKLYLGHTSNLNERIRKHNTNHKGFAGKFNDWELVYHEEYQSKSEAYQRELQIKKWKNKNRIQELIAKGSAHPD